MQTSGEGNRPAGIGLTVGGPEHYLAAGMQTLQIHFLQTPSSRYEDDKGEIQRDETLAQAH